MSAESCLQRVPARERLLSTACELFYDEGVHTVGVDRIVERAVVAKSTLYTAFGSKDGLIRAYLVARHESTRARMTRELSTRYDTPRDRLLGVFDVLGESFTEPAFRGCAFVRANAESSPGTSVAEVTNDHRTWLRALFLDLAKQTGVPDPDVLAQQLVLLYDGAGISAWIDHDPTAAKAARTVAAVLVDEAIRWGVADLGDGSSAPAPSSASGG